MNLGLYVHRETPVHALPAAAKIIVLFVAGIGVFLIREPLWLAVVLAVVAAVMAVARVPVAETVRQLRPIAVLLLAIFLVHGAFTSWTLGLLVVLRFAILLLLALTVTFTTRVSEMIDTLERGLRPLSMVGVNPAKVSLMLSMTLRFIPLLVAKYQEIREAQKVRGLERSLTALVVPLLVKTLRMAAELTDAIDSRCYDPDQPRR